MNQVLTTLLIASAVLVASAIKCNVGKKVLDCAAELGSDGSPFCVIYHKVKTQEVISGRDKEKSCKNNGDRVAVNLVENGVTVGTRPGICCNTDKCNVPKLIPMVDCYGGLVTPGTPDVWSGKVQKCPFSCIYFDGPVTKRKGGLCDVAGDCKKNMQKIKTKISDTSGKLLEEAPAICCNTPKCNQPGIMSGGGGDAQPGVTAQPGATGQPGATPTGQQGGGNTAASSGGAKEVAAVMLLPLVTFLLLAQA